MTPHAMASASEEATRARRGILSTLLGLLLLLGLLSPLEAQRPGGRGPRARRPAAGEQPPAGKEEKKEEKKEERGLVTAFFLGRVWPGDGPAIDDAVILVREGKIVACGPKSEVEVPPFARRIERREMTVTPGLVHVASLAYQRASGWSVGNPAMNATNDVVERLDPDAETCEWIARSGFTTLAEGLPGGGFVGQGALLRPVKAPRHELVAVDSIVREKAAVLSAGFPVNTAGKKFFAETLKKASEEIERRKKEAKAKPEEGKKADPKKPEEGKKAEEKKPEGKKEGEKKEEEKKAEPEKKAEEKKRKPDPKLDVVISALEGELPVVLAVPGASGFLRLEALLKEHKAFKPALLSASQAAGGRRGGFFMRRTRGGGASDFWRVKDKIKALGLPVVMSPALSTVPGTITRLVPARAMIEAGVPVALVPTSENEGGYRAMWWALSDLVRHGVSPEQALRAVTVTPAEILGVQERYGSIEEGRMADLLFFDGDPFAPTTRLVEVRVANEVVHSKEASS